MAARNPPTCSGPDRREAICAGGLAAVGLGLPGLLAGRAAASGGSGRGEPAARRTTSGRAKACILLWMSGGPPQHDTFDPKPDAPVEIRGELGSIPTVVPGVRVGGMMPLTARRMDDIAVLRAVSTADNAHTSSGYWMLTGVKHFQGANRENLTVSANDWPGVAAMVKRFRPAGRQLPSAVALPEPIYNDGRIIWPGQNAGWMGREFDPWLVDCDPVAPDFQIQELRLPADVPAVRLDRRRKLLEQINGSLDTLAGSAVQRHDVWSRQGFDLLTGPAVRRAFDLSAEPDKVRDRYGREGSGRTKWGQCVLLARRLIEAGVPLVQVNWPRDPRSEAGSPVWDTHNNGYKHLKFLMPTMDQGYSALLEDLKSRGLLDDTLVVWAGEFGRTPKLKPGGGRDHWGPVFSVALAGGGVRGGAVHGASDRNGAYPADGLVQPPDLTATILHALGIDPRTEIRDRLNRPFPLSDGRVLHGLF